MLNLTITDPNDTNPIPCTKFYFVHAQNFSAAEFSFMLRLNLLLQKIYPLLK